MMRQLKRLAMPVIVLLGLGLGLSSLIFAFSTYFYSAAQPQNILLVSSNPELTQDLILMRHLPRDERVVIMAIDAQIPVEVIGGYDQYPVRSVYPLLKMDNRSPEFISASLAQALGVVIDQIWVLDQIPDLSEAERLQNSLDLMTTADHQSWQQKLFFLGFMLKYRMNQLIIEQQRLTELPVQASDLSLSGSDQTAVSQCSVSVVNATTINKLGKRYAQLLEQNGFRVVRVTDSTDIWPSSVVIWRAELPACQAAVDRMLTTLPSHQVQFDLELADRHRADVVVMLGQDFE